MVAMPAFRRSAEMSLSTTSKPASAATCAMPPPIWPAPITPTLLISAILSSTGTAHQSRPPHYKQHPPQLAHPADVLTLLPELAEFLRQLGNRLVEIRDQTVISNLEDRRVLVLVDGDDHLGILHPGEMLDRAGDADRDVQARRHGLPGLADLSAVLPPARVHHRAARAHRGIAEGR